MTTHQWRTWEPRREHPDESTDESTDESSMKARHTGAKPLARTCTGALAICARCTRPTIWASTVSLPTRVARMSSAQEGELMVPPMRASPGCFHT